jgi:hypothetical protein
MGENTSNERAVRTGPGEAGSHAGHDMSGMADGKRVPGFPADMMDMMGMLPEADLRKINKPETRGMRRNWFAGVEALHTIVRVLPPDLYDQVVSGKGDVPPGASVPGGGPGEMPGMHGGHEHGGMDMPKDEGKSGGQEGHEHHH